MSYERSYRLVGVCTSLVFLSIALFIGIATIIQLFQLRINEPIEAILALVSSLLSVLLAKSSMNALISSIIDPVPPPEQENS